MFTPSAYQQAVFDWIEQGSGDAVVNAVAGSGKTTTLLQAATRLHVRHALFVAFNKLIADELSTRLQANSSIMRASTIHSLGKGCIETHLGTKTRVVGNKYLKLCRNYLKARGNAYEGMARNLQKLVSFAQLTLTDPTQANLIQIVNHYDLKDIHVLEDSWSVLWPAVRIILDAGIQQFQHEHVVDFNDMVWLPTACNTSTPQYEFLFVDECQDLNRAQLELILKCRAPGGRLLFVGDRRQSLYGFAGADTESVNNIVKRTQAKELPLSICYRCATSHIELARQVVSEIEPSPYAPEGEVGVVKSATLAQAEPSRENTIAILCRTTAPLVSACLKALQQGKRAIVRGKDIGASIIDILDKIAELKHTGLFRVEDIPPGLDYYRQIQLAALQAKEDNELAIESLYDRCDTVEALYMAYLTTCEESKTTPVMQGLKDFITSKFDDSMSEDTLIFSTVHKAKGLEFDTIYILKSELMPHPAAKKGWQIDQEYNIIYVALTRAKQRLFFLDKAIPWLILPGGDEITATTEEPITPVAEAVSTQKEKRGRGRPRKGEEIRDRVNISLDVDVIRFLRSQKNYSELIESLIQALPEFDDFIKQ